MRSLDEAPGRSRVRWHPGQRGEHWWSFVVLVLCAAAALAAPAWLFRRAERDASSARAEWTATMLARGVADAARAEGRDLSTVVEKLTAGSTELRIALVERPLDAAQGSPRRVVVAHADRALVGREWDVSSADLAWARAALEAATDPAMLPELGYVASSAVDAGGRRHAIVAGVRAIPLGSRPFMLALVTLAFFAAFAAGLQDLFPLGGRIANSVALPVVAFAFMQLLVNLEPSLWRGNPGDPLVLRAEALDLPDLAHALARDLDAPASGIAGYALPMLVLVTLFQFASVAGLWAAIRRAVGREALAHVLATPAAAALALLVAFPLGRMAARLAVRAGPSGFDWVLPRSLADFGAPDRAFATAYSLCLTACVAVVSVAAELTVAVALGLAIRRLSSLAPAARTALGALAAIPVGVLATGLGTGLPTEAVEPGTALLQQSAAAAWLGLPLLTLLVCAALNRIPRQVEEAARLDGVDPVRRLLLVVLPQIRPTLFLAFAIGVVLSANGSPVSDAIARLSGPAARLASQLPDTTPVTNDARTLLAWLLPVAVALPFLALSRRAAGASR